LPPAISDVHVERKKIFKPAPEEKAIAAAAAEVSSNFFPTPRRLFQISTIL
jgi:hypothetical protein